MSEEVIVRPDFESVVADEKNRELIEEFERRRPARSPVGGPGS
jgi:hypothetical protein